jgi:glucose/mannose-6-phosphate isomerase
MTRLDDVMAMKRIDPDRMIDRINELPTQFRDALRNVNQFALPASYRSVANIVVLGMGGSAIGGDLVRTLVGDELKVPMLIARDYTLPGFVGPDSLVIGSSYSGATEETLSAFEEAKRRGAKILAVTTGGKIKTIAEQVGAPVLQYSYQSQPRAAVGHSIVPIIGILQKLGLIEDKTADLEEAANLMDAMREEYSIDVPLAENIAKQQAANIEGHIPVIYGEGILSEVARRWKGQINENSKSWAFYELFPELNHNAVVGYEFPVDLANRIIVLFLTSKTINPRVQVRVSVTQEILTNRGVAWQEIKSRGESPMAQMMSSLYFGDFVSYYLAIIYGVDPTPVKVISFLKNRLAQIS